MPNCSWHQDREEEARNQAVVSLARGMQVPLAATNGVCHVHPAQRQVLDVFTCLHHKVTLAAAGRLLTRNAERHLKSGAEMAHLFRDYPEAIANTAEVSAQLGFELTDLGYEFPRYPVPYGQSEIDFCGSARARRRGCGINPDTSARGRRLSMSWRLSKSSNWPVTS